MDNSTDSAALEKILGDMDDMESNRVYGDKPGQADAGVSITIDVAPKKAEDKKEEPKLDAEPDMDDESGMPTFLRKRS